MQAINFNFFFKITIIPLIFLLSNCANNKVIESSNSTIVKEEKKSVIEKKICSERSKVTSSTNNYIRFKHDISEVDEYNKVAAEWCSKFSKIAIRSKLNCGSCCNASYRCR